MTVTPTKTRARGGRNVLLGFALALTFACALGRGADAQQVPFDDNPSDETEAAPMTAPDAGTQPAVRVVLLVPDASVPVAQGRLVRVTAGDLVRVVNDAPEPVQRQWASDARALQSQLDRLVTDRLLVEEARRRGLESDPLVRAAVERALVSRLRATAINPVAGDETAVTMEEIRRFYDAHPERFHIPERRRAWLLFVRDRRTAEQVLREAQPPPPPRRGRRRHSAHTPRPPSFRELIRTYNTAPELAATDGELVDVTLASPSVDANIRTALFALERAGDLHPTPIPGTINGRPGYYVLRFGGRRAPVERSLEQSSEWIRRRLVLQRRVDAEQRLVEQLRVGDGVNTSPVERVLRVELVDAGPG